jgi:hypothetical protein
MKLFCILLMAFSLAGFPAWATLNPGDAAPNFTAQASLGGKVISFSLAEAHNFAEATDTFAALGATVIGVSGDKIETLNKFSVTECRNKFAVAADPDKKIMKAYRATMLGGLLGMADRTSYVITPDDRVLFAYSALDPNGHVDKTLEAVRGWRAQHAASDNSAN